MRFVVYGAGGIGGTIGARLHLAGYPVQLIARGAHGAALQATGLHFVAPGINEKLIIPTVLHPQEVDWAGDDVVLLCMKTQHTAVALDDLRAAGVKDQAIVCAQNGVANEAMALRCFPNVYSMLVFLPGQHLEPGQVVSNATDKGGVLDTGRYPSGSDTTVERLTGALSAAGFRAEPDASVLRKKYAKLLTNLMNGVTVLVDMQEDTRELAKLLRDEALACYSAAGIDCAGPEGMKELYKAVQYVAMEEFPRGGGSSWQSAVRGTGNVEVDYLSGEIVHLGRYFGVPTPANATCQRLAWDLVRRGAKPGAFTANELLELIQSSSL